MNLYEEELQKALENGRVPLQAEPLDVKAYRQVFRALKKEPSYHLPDNFAHQVAAQINEQQQSRSLFDDLWIALGLLFLAIAFVAAIIITGVTINFGFLNTLADYKGLVVFGAVLLVLLNWLDHKLLKSKRAEA
jgi:hypothetical protein